MGKMYLLENIVNKANMQVEGFAIVKNATVKTNSKGAAYLDMTLIDGGGDINAKLWDYNSELHGEYSADSIIKVRASVTLWQDIEQLRIDKIRKYNPDKDELDMTRLVPCAPFDSEYMYDELKTTAEGFSDKELSRLVLYMLEANKERLLICPAALKLHHAHRGGLLYHTLSILNLGKSVCANYPALDSDLVYAGIILHDLSKISELTVGEIGLASGYSVEGQLLGHINMGVAQIALAAKELGISDELRMLVQHIVLAHHSTPEFGSPRPPMFPEAEVVATLDMLDARMFEMFEALENTQKGGFTDRQWALDNRMLFKHGHGS
jgi:3'-5' exoribonuclease